MVGRYGASAARADCLAASICDSACTTAGPRETIEKSSSSLRASALLASSSIGCAVTISTEPTSRESAALAVAMLLRDVRMASRALPTWIDERRESERVAAPAATRAVAARSCCSDCSSCLVAALSDSRAARTAKYCCFTLSATVKLWAISDDSAASRFDCAALRLK